MIALDEVSADQSMGGSARLGRERFMAFLLASTILLSGCGIDAVSSARNSGHQTEASNTRGRIAFHPLMSKSGTQVGSIDVRSSADGTVTLDLEIDDQFDVHPWGIYAQEACGPPAPDLDSPFQFADIEGGRRTELIEGPSFLSFEANLVAIVLSTGGSEMYGCADLGSAEVTARPSSDAPCEATVPSDAALTSDTIAFSRAELSDSEIYLMQADGSDIRRLTVSLGLDVKPTWSPDGRQIAFRTQRDGNDEIYVMDANGTCNRNLTNSRVDDRSPAWSPDGRTIAFDHFFEPTFQDIAVIDVDGIDLQRVTTGSGEYPSWSPDGQRLAFASARTGQYEIYVINRDGTDEQRLTRNGAYNMYPAWSPDGSRIAFERGLDGSDDSMEIYTMAIDGTDLKQITSNTQNDRFPAWSADGRLAWSESGTIVVANSADARPLPVGNGQFPSWYP